MWQVDNSSYTPIGLSGSSTITVSGLTNSDITFVSATSSYVTITSGSGLIGNSTLYTSYSSPYDDLIDFINMVAKISGIPIDYDKYSKMTEGEREAFIRLQKIKKIEE